MGEPPVIDRRFALESEHKRGGMGTVWRARDLVTQQPVALKILHAAVADQSERFLREATLLSDMSHAGIVSYIAHGTTADGVPYLAMEWLDGETVAERLARQPLTLLESLRLVAAAARGLTFAHRLGIVHRDLKPSNLFLRQGRVDDVVLLDLGVARHLGRPSDLTRTGSIVGTPTYMAPEQAQGLRDVTSAADVFSLGCVLFECLTGDPPFLGDHVFAVLAKVLFEDAPRLREVRPDMPAAVETLLERMLAKDAAGRMPDADALMSALGVLGEMEEIEAPAPAAPTTPWVSEQELVSVILATRDPEPGDRAAEGDTLPSGASSPDVSAYGGVLKRLADGTLVIALAQRREAATDLAARAARCALHLRDSRSATNVVLATGRGIASGRAYIGEAVDRAGAMLRSSSDGAIRVDEVTAGLLDARFRISRTDGDLLVLVGDDPSIDPTRPLLGRPTACVGREHELGMLELALRACVQESSPRAVLVMGQPGMGKSRLRHELLRRTQAHGDDILALVGLGDPLRPSGARGLLGGAVSRLCGIQPERPEDQNVAALEERIGRHLPGERRRTAAFMGELCGCRYPGDALPELQAARQNPRIMADLVTQAWLTFLRAEAAVRPVLLVLDDLQWADALTISLVDSALRDLGGSPVMVLALARPEVLELFPDLWAPRLTVLPLHPLSAAATARLIQQVLGDQVARDSVERIVARSAGNALYLEELIRAAEARRAEVPETVLAMLQARIGLLPPAARRLLRAASIFGETFPIGGVAALLPAAATGEDVDACLRIVGKHEILEQQADRAGDRWRFRHVLMRDAAYGLLTPEDRGALHAAAARHLEAAGEDAAVVASHWERGGRPGQAVRHYTLAAEQAYRRNDLGAAISLVTQGVSCGASGEQRGILACIEAPICYNQNNFSAGLRASREALELLPPGHPRRIECLSWAIYCGFQVGKSDEIQGHLEEMLATDLGTGQPGDHMIALGHASISYVALGDRTQASRLLSRIAAIDAMFGDEDPLVRGLALYWQMRFEELLGDDPYSAWTLARGAMTFTERAGDRRMASCSQVEVGECARRLGSMAEGLAEIRQAVELSRAVGEPVPLAFVMQYLATLLAEHGAAEDLLEARALAREALELAGDASVYTAMAQISLALVSLREGDLADAEVQSRGAHAIVHRMRMRSYYPHADTTLLTVLVRAGDGAAAGALADEALANADALGTIGLMEIPLRLAAARAHLCAGRRDDATRGVVEAQARLARRAAQIDPARREDFLTRVPEHAALRELAVELGLGSGG